MALLAQQIADLAQPIGALGAPLQPQFAQLDSIPGGALMAARAMIAEIGGERRRWGAAGRLAAWAHVSPGNTARAGPRRQSRTGPGKRDLRRLLGPWAGAARKTPTFLGRTFRRLAGRLGKQKAAVAMVLKMLGRMYHRRAAGTSYDEQRSAHLPPQPADRWPRHAVETLKRLGSRAVLDKRASKPGAGHH